MLGHLSITLWLLMIALGCLGATEATLLPPACQGAAPNKIRLNDVRTARLNVSGPPFGVVFASPYSSPNRAFAAVNDTLAILDTSELTPRLLHSISLLAVLPGAKAARGVAITHDGRHVLVANVKGAIVVSAAEALQGSANAIVGILDGPIAAGASVISLTVSNNDEYAFIGQEYGSNATRRHGDIEVFKLQKPAANGTVSGSYVGYVVLGYAVAGLALSPDGRILYATSEIVNTNTTQGTLSVIYAEKLKTDPSKALLYTFDAGCSPVRVITSWDGKTVWVTVRESNRLLAFDAAKLLSNSSEPLLASVQVGTSPVGLIFVRNGTRILMADSNRFHTANTMTGLSVVDVDAALTGREAVLGQIPTGKFPREFAISPDGNTILVFDYGSDQIQALDVATLP